MNDKLKEILQYYVDTYEVKSSIEDVYDELVANGVEVHGDSFYCEVNNGDSLVLLAGTKEHADTWVLKKIIKLIKTGVRFYSLLNGNSEHLIKMMSRYNLTVLKRDGDMSLLQFN